MTAGEIVDLLALVGEGVIWTAVILVVLLIIVTSRADKE